MTPQQVTDLITFAQTAMAINSAALIAGLIVGVRLVRTIARMELQFDLMWKHFDRTVLTGEPDDEDR